jgi:lysophospholipase L1-like esterase
MMMCAVLFGLLFVSALQAANTALEPVDRKDKWWVDRHAGNVAQIEKDDVELLLIGDSITHNWDKHAELYQKYFGKYKPVNLGFSGDQTQHVLWRLDHLPLDKIQPKVAQIMIGTNNVGNKSLSAKDIAEGIKAIVVKLQKQYPKLQIVVLKVFPRDEKPDGERRKRVDAVNAELPSLLKGLKNVELVDINQGFLDKDGTLPKSIMKDALHPDKDGHDYWGKAVQPIIEKKYNQYDQSGKKFQRPNRPNRLRNLFR